MNLNKVIISGRLTKNPELRSTKSGASVTSMSMATNRVWMDKDGNKREEPDYHNVVVWGKQAESTAKYLLKGQLALVEGRLQTRMYEKEGQKHYVTEIVAENIQFGPKKDQAGSGSYKRTESQTGSEIEEIPTIDIDGDIKAEDLPF